MIPQALPAPEAHDCLNTQHPSLVTHPSKPGFSHPSFSEYCLVLLYHKIIMKTIWRRLSSWIKASFWSKEVKGPQPALERLLSARQIPCEDRHTHTFTPSLGTMTLDSTDLDLNPGITTWWLCDRGQVTSFLKFPFSHQQSDNYNNIKFTGCPDDQTKCLMQ